MHHQPNQFPRNQDPLNRLRSIGLVALHVSVALLSLLLIVAGFAYWPLLEGLSDLIIIVLAGLGIISTWLNTAAAYVQARALIRHNKAPGTDYIALAFAIIVLFIAVKIFSPSEPI